MALESPALVFHLTTFDIYVTPLGHTSTSVKPHVRFNM